MSAWIDRSAALSRLRIKAQTLYAYVSRGRIRVQPDPTDSRRSLYNAADIASITFRKVRGRSPSRIAASSMDWGEPAIETAISSIENGQLRYRGQDAIAFASAATLEEAAQLLWRCDETPEFAGRAVRTDQNTKSRWQVLVGAGGDLAERCGQQGSVLIFGHLDRAADQ